MNDAKQDWEAIAHRYQDKYWEAQWLIGELEQIRQNYRRFVKDLIND